MNEMKKTIYFLLSIVLLTINYFIIKDKGIEFHFLGYYFRALYLFILIEGAFICKKSNNRRGLYLHLLMIVNSMYIFAEQFIKVETQIIYIINITSLLLTIYGAIELFRHTKIYLNSINSLMYYDILTNLPTRNFLLRNSSRMTNDKNNVSYCDIDHVIGKSQQSAFMFLNINDFKTINDFWGHFYGDMIIKEIAHRITKCTDKDDIVIHLSGDEFLIIINNINNKSYETKAQCILGTINKPFIINHNLINITCNIGISLFPKDGITVESLLKKADITMHEAKKKGKNGYLLFESNYTTTFNDKYILVQELKKAITNKEFIVYYQPKVKTDTNEVFSLEALARWVHPTQGVIFPKAFISLAEDLKIIDQIDSLIIHEVCKQIKFRKDNNLKTYSFSVNISPVFFNSYNFINTFFSIIDSYDIDCSLITVEITESVAIGDVKHYQKILNSLREKNIKIALDDFGKGYSSLSYIKDFPIDYLKIDKRFIKKMDESKTDEMIVNYVQELSNTLNVLTIAEGVETEAQLELIKKIGTYAYQGYLYSKPAPIEDLDL